MNQPQCSAVLTVLLILSSLPLFAQSNGGFESGLANWTATPASSVTIATNPNLLFPSEGSQYAIVSAGNGSQALPGFGPYTAGGGVGEVTMLSRTFTRPGGSNCFVTLDWTFVSRENPGAFLDADFFAINIRDASTGVLVDNVLYVDNEAASGFLPYNSVPGGTSGEIGFVQSIQNLPFILPSTNPRSHEVAPSGFKRAQCDISATTLVGQSLVLEIVVSNGTDAENDSYAYIDNFEIRSGKANRDEAGMRVLGDQSDRFYQSGGHAEGQYMTRVPYIEKLTPGGNATIALAADPGPQGFALLAGTFKPETTLSPIGEFNLFQSQPIVVLIDGLNPSSPIEALIGTIGGGEKYIDVTVPETVGDFELGLQAVMTDPSSPPFNLRLTAATELEISDDLRIPLGTQPVLNMAQETLGDDDVGIVDLSAMDNGNGFPFFGVSYTQAFVSSNGNLTFSPGGADFAESAATMFLGAPRIAPFWDDLNPDANSGGGAVNFSTNATGGFVPLGPTRVVISWERVPGFSQSANGNSFSVVLYNNGTIEFHYGSLTESDGVVGITPGGLSSPINPEDAEVDFSLLSAFHYGEEVIAPGGAPFFEQFVDDQDVLNWGTNGRPTLVFSPVADGGFPYRVYCGSGSN